MEIPKKRSDSKRPPLEVLAKEYSKMTAKQIARKYQVSEATVRAWIFRARKKKAESEV